jgi:hypothetical protein
LFIGITQSLDLSVSQLPKFSAQEIRSPVGLTLGCLGVDKVVQFVNFGIENLPWGTVVGRVDLNGPIVMIGDAIATMAAQIDFWPLDPRHFAH